MHPNQHKEEFSRAYVRAVASVAGVKVSTDDVDDDSIDLKLERSGQCSPKLDLQLKCTTDIIPKEGDLSFVLKLKNYDDLRRPTLAPRWLVVLFVPDDAANWLECSPDQLILRHCAWWTSLAGADESDNRTSVTVKLPRANVFTPQAVTAKLDEITSHFRPASHTA